jgi:hypothetical protein
MGLNDVTNFLQNFLFDFGECSAHARPRCESMSTATKPLTDDTDINGFSFRTHADTHLAIGQFFEKHGDDNTTNRSEMID